MDMFTNNQSVLRGLFGYERKPNQTDAICKALSRALFESHTNYCNILAAMAQDSTHLNKVLWRIGKQQISAAMEWVEPPSRNAGGSA